MNEDNLNMEVYKFLKKIGISSQRTIENEIKEALKNGNIKIGDEIELEMKLSLKNLNKENIINGKIILE